MKRILFWLFLFALPLGLLLSPAFAHDGHHEGGDTINNYNYDSTFDGAQGCTDCGNDGDDERDRTRAMSAAGDVCVFDYAPGWQGCGGAGFYDNAQGYNASAVTRVDQFMVRMNVQTDDQFDKYAVGIGGSWHF
jgi:hypothetical protein